MNLHIIRKLTKQYLRNSCKKSVYFHCFEIFLFECMSILGPAQPVLRKLTVELLVEKWKNIGFCWNCMKDDCLTSLGCLERFLSLSNLFDLFSTGKIGKKSIFENPIISQTVSIKTCKKITNTETIILHIFRKLMKNSLKILLVETMFTLTFFQILLL